MSNKQVKIKKIKKRRLRVKRVFVLALIIFIIVFACTKIVKIPIKSIVVNGNNYLNDSTIIKESGLKGETSLLKISENKVCKKLKNIDMVNSCEIKKTWDFKIVIEIKENKPLFLYLYTNEIALSNGKMIKDTNKYGVPTLINYVPEEILKEFITGLNNIEDDIIHSISEIEYSPSQNGDGTFIDKNRFMLNMNDGNTVYTNNPHIDVLNYYKKIYASIYSSIGNQKGIYYLDCDFDNYYFKAYDAD